MAVEDRDDVDGSLSVRDIAAQYRNVFAPFSVNADLLAKDSSGERSLRHYLRAISHPLELRRYAEDEPAGGQGPAQADEGVESLEKIPEARRELAIEWRGDEQRLWGVSLEYSIDAGQTWQPLTNSVIRTHDQKLWGKFPWQVPLSGVGKEVCFRVVEYPARRFLAKSTVVPHANVKLKSIQRTRVKTGNGDQLVEDNDEILTGCLYQWEVETDPPAARPTNLRAELRVSVLKHRTYFMVTMIGRKETYSCPVDFVKTEYPHLNRSDLLATVPYFVFGIPTQLFLGTPEEPIESHGWYSKAQTATLLQKQLYTAFEKCCGIPNQKFADGMFLGRGWDKPFKATLIVELVGESGEGKKLSLEYRVSKGPDPIAIPDNLSTPNLTASIKEGTVEKGVRLDLWESNVSTIRGIDLEQYVLLRDIDGAGFIPIATLTQMGKNEPYTRILTEKGSHTFQVTVQWKHPNTGAVLEKSSNKVTYDVVDFEAGRPSPVLRARNVSNGEESTSSLALFPGEGFRLTEIALTQFASDNHVAVGSYTLFWMRYDAPSWTDWYMKGPAPGPWEFFDLYGDEIGTYQYKVKVSFLGNDYVSAPVQIVVATIGLECPTQVGVNTPFTLEAHYDGHANLLYRFQIRSRGHTTWDNPMADSDLITESRYTVSGGLPSLGNYEARVSVYSADDRSKSLADSTITEIRTVNLSVTLSCNPTQLATNESLELTAQPGPGKTVDYYIFQIRPDGKPWAEAVHTSDKEPYNIYRLANGLPEGGSYEARVLAYSGTLEGESNICDIRVVARTPVPNLSVPERVDVREPFELAADIAGAYAQEYLFEIRPYSATNSLEEPVFRFRSERSGEQPPTDYCTVPEGLRLAGEYKVSVQVTYPERVLKESVACLRVAFALSASVGVGGSNQPNDVLALIDRLVSLGFHWTTEANLTQVIRLFQSIVAGQQSIAGNGLVSVPAPGPNSVYNWLRAENAPRWIELPTGSRAAGFYNSERMEEREGYHYATNWFAEEIRLAGVYYHDNYLATHSEAVVITLNDASQERGGHFNDHAGHETGLSCDIKLPRTGGTAGGGVNYYDPTDPTKLNPRYDQNATRAQLQALRRPGSLVDHIYFNDPALIGESLCTASGGHDNHIHFEIHAPARREGQGFD